VPRYLVRRTFPGGLAILANQAGAEALRRVVETNAKLGVTWLYSYISEDKQTSFCIWDGPAPEAIRRASEASGLPVDSITQITVLDPHFYH
jgi:hypothetical protein